ncbi:hypothetical protein SynSYN20_01451 [Synechococcus sp. SYN20]|uniref:hypothetical protein n=1 Tax=Synechococcus sp. SYN20 TaxID=1050714 RepID=UPI001644DB00|nr:hypothetical protein [Synechococcus sp. SYN20]QNJ25779.1 hypothetical protein SynSYN20_01451 [Synechococcus sp. SYN20]
MISIERLTPNGWKPSASQADIHSAVTYAKALCMEEPSTYRVLRNSDLICLVRQQGIIWINASSEVMGETQIEETVSV